MSWNRAPVAAALVDMITAAAEGAVRVHNLMPETLNPMCVVIGRPASVRFASAAFGIDEAELPLTIVGGVETENAVEALKLTVRQAVEADSTLAGTVQVAWPSEERNWRNMTGAGGIQLLLVELVVTIQM